MHGYSDSDILRYRRVSQVSHMQRGVIVSDHERSKDLRPRYYCVHHSTDRTEDRTGRQARFLPQTSVWNEIVSDMRGYSLVRGDMRKPMAAVAVLLSRCVPLSLDVDMPSEYSRVSSVQHHHKLCYVARLD